MLLATENEDLRDRRRALGLSLDDVIRLLYPGRNPGAVRPSLSRFERKNEALPHGKTRADYETLLDAVEYGQKGNNS